MSCTCAHLELFEGLFATSSPILLKACLELLGLPAGPLRPPLVDATADQVEFARGLLAGVGLGAGRAGAVRRIGRPVTEIDRTLPPAGPGVTRVAFLGGLGEIGRNCAVVELDGARLLIDCGLAFPDADQPGVDIILPDFTWLAEEPERVVGVVLTHAHEDHMGALPYFLRDFDVPVYGTRLSLAMLSAKLEEHQLSPSLVEVAARPADQPGPVRPRVLRHVALDPRRHGGGPAHPRGHDRAHRRLQDGPDPDRRPARPTWAGWPGWPPRGSTSSCRTPPTPSSPASSSPRSRSAGPLRTSSRRPGAAS